MVWKNVNLYEIKGTFWKLSSLLAQYCMSKKWSVKICCANQNSRTVLHVRKCMWITVIAKYVSLNLNNLPDYSLSSFLRGFSSSYSNIITREDGTLRIQRISNPTIKKFRQFPKFCIAFIIWVELCAQLWKFT